MATEATAIPQTLAGSYADGYRNWLGARTIGCICHVWSLMDNMVGDLIKHIVNNILIVER